MATIRQRLGTAAPSFALALATTLLGLGPVRAEAPAGDRYALLIAVRQYDKNELRDLPYSEDDVTALAAVLRKAGYKRVILMTQTEGAASARALPLAANIRKTLKGILEDRTADDSVLVAFAGHGVQYKGEDESYFCPMDARLDDKQTLISLGDVYKELEASGAGMRLLVVDACRNDPRSDESRAVSRVKLESVTRPQKALPPGGVAALFSCSAGEKAFESGTLKHGVFFHFLIEGLQGKADLDGDGQIDLDELVRYTKKQVPDFVKEQYGEDVRQMPELVGKTRGLMTLARVDGGGRPDTTTSEKPKNSEGAFTVGSRVFGRWAPDGLWYPGVVKEAKGGQYFIHFDDDDTAWLAAGNVTTYAPAVGDRVQGNRDGKGLYYKGKVTTRQGEKIHISYDDGNEEDTTISSLRVAFRDDKPKEPDAPAASGPFKVGRRVFARWSPDGFWYSGTIKEAKDGKCLIVWDEDDQQKWLEPGDLTTYQPRVGDRIEGDWLGKGKYYRGRVTSRRGEKVHILYDDGDEEDTTIGRLRAEYDGTTVPGR